MQKGNPLPDRIGPYRVQRQLSATGSAKAYLAREEGPLGFARDVVLKVGANPAAGDTDAVKELTREATICAKLNHPGIVRTFQFFEYGEELVLVLEHVDGISLQDLLAHRAGKARSVSDDAVLHVGVSMLDALAHAHATTDEHGKSTPVVHRALNPSHVMLARDGVVKLAGFGFAKILGRSSDTQTSLKWDPVYMSPEQATDQRLTPKWDIYAAGLLLWELLSGRPALDLPKGPLPIEETLRRVAERRPASLGELRRDLPRELVAAVDAALAPLPEKRTITCAEMAQWIRKVANVGRGKKELAQLVAAELAAAPPIPTPRVEPPQALGRLGPDGRKRQPTLLGLAPVRGLAPTPASGGSTLRPNLGGPAAPPRAAAPAFAPAAPTAAAPALQRPPGTAPPPASPALDEPQFIPPLAPPPLAAAPSGPPPLPPAPLPPPSVTSPIPQAAGELPAPPAFLDGALAAAGLAAVQPAPVDPLAQTFVVSPIVEPTAPTSHEEDADAEQARSLSFVDRLRAPTPFRRKPWLAAWILLGAFGPLLLLWLALSSRASKVAASPSREPATGSAAAIARDPTPPSVPTVAPPTVAPPITPAAVTVPEVELPAAAPRPIARPVPAAAPMIDKPRPPPGFGYLMVHSTAAYASVFVQLVKYGRVEGMLTVPCGKRWISVGVPTRKGREPVWIAPGTAAVVPCGGLLELTIDPHKVR